MQIALLVASVLLANAVAAWFHRSRDLDTGPIWDGDCCAVTALTEAHLSAVEEKIADLLLLKDRLSSPLTSCRGGLVADCRIIDALNPRQ
nr:hypothetical protein [uncultured Duganella sp.]